MGFAWVALAAAIGGAVAPAPSLVLISFDTTRYDALSCNGAPPDLGRDPGVVTPHVDALAAEGLRFEHFYAHAPTTLSSHTSMLTGLDPHAHVVPRNGFPVDPGVTTLAERLADAGWDTVAVVGAAALEADMGLDQGFRIYDDAMTARRGPMYQDTAEGVVDRALGHLADRDRARPLFLFVHLYDPHGPFEPPTPWSARWDDPAYDGPRPTGVGAVGETKLRLRQGQATPGELAYHAGQYLGEVAYADHHVGRLLDALQADGVLDRAVVVVTADHGEVLSDPVAFAYSHGTDVTDAAVHIPLIVRGYGVPLGQGVVTRHAAMEGLAPTLERALGLEPTLGARRDFWDLVRPGPVRDDEGWPSRPTRVVLSEATRPRPQEASDPLWNNLPFARAVRVGEHTLTASPVHHEPPRADDPGLLDVLASLLGWWDADAPPHRAEGLSDATRAALEALGYLDDDG